MRKILLVAVIFMFAGLVWAGKGSIPPLNKKIVKYITSVMGKQVDRGECWDLANAALTKTGAKFDRSSKKTIYTYGQKINPKKDEVFPGDMIQFTNVVLKYTKGNTEYTEQMGQHTAVVYQVYEPGEYQIAHQNTSFSGRKVGLSNLKLADVQKGKLEFYRPVPD